MGTRIVPARYRGIARPDPRMEWWDSESGVFSLAGVRESALGEASPIAGIPVPAQVTDLSLRASGEQEVDLEVLINRPGLPVIDGLGYLWRLDGESADLLRGCDLPVPLAGTLPVGSAAGSFTPHVISLQSGGILTAYRGATGAVYVSGVLVDATAITDPYPCLLQLPSGRVLLYRWADDGADHQVRCWYSDDDGATWTQQGPVLLDALSGAVYPTRRRLRAVYLDGVIALFGHVVAVDTGVGIWRDRIVQWASSEGGTLFDRVTISDGSDLAHQGAWHDVCLWRGEIVLARLVKRDGAAEIEIRIRRLASGWYPWTSGDELAVTGGDAFGTLLGVYTAPVGGVSDGRINEGECALWADDETSLYLTGRHCSGAHDGASPILRSVDGGETWLATGTSALYAGRGQPWYWTGSPDEEASSLTACANRGRSVVVHTASRSAAATDLLFATYIGGWQTVPMPSVSQQISPTRRTTWDHTGVAHQLPDECGWTLAAIGAPVIALQHGYLSVTTAPGESVVYSITPTGTAAQGIITEHGLEVASGQAEIRILLRDATPADWDCEVRVTPTTILLWDNNAGAQVGSTLTYAGGPVAIRISQSTDHVRVFAHVPGDAVLLASASELCDPDRPFVEVAKTPTLAAGGGAAANLVLWTTTASSVVYWYWWPYVSGAYVGDLLYTQPTRQRMPRSMVETPSWCGRGVSLSSVSGPAAVGDLWDVPSSAEYPYAAMLPQVSPSPRHPWRSTSYSPGSLIGAVGPTGRLSWRIGTVDQSALVPLWGVLLDGLTMGGVEVWLHYGGAWHLAGSVGYWAATCARYGRTLQVTSGSATYSAVLRRDELAGCLCEYVSGGPPATQSDYQHTITSNEPGAMDTSAGVSLPLRFTVDSSDPAEPNAPSVRIYPRRALLLLDLSLTSTEIVGIQIRWPIPRHLIGTPYPIPGPSPLLYHGVATFAAGPLWAWGTTHSDARRLAHEVETEIVTAEDGTRTAYRRAPLRRRWSVSWSDPVSQHQHDGTDHDPDYIAHGSGKPALAFRGSTPADLADQLRALEGALVPVVYVPSVDSGGSGRPDHWADGAMVCRIVSAVEHDAMTGDEERGDAVRVQELVLEEEV